MSLILSPSQARACGFNGNTSKTRMVLGPHKSATTPEAEIVKSILAYLKLHGAFVWRQNSGAMTGEYKGKRRFVKFQTQKGMSDIIGIWRGQFLAIEVKRKDGKATAQQNAFLDSVNHYGGIGFVARSIDDVRKGLAL